MIGISPFSSQVLLFAQSGGTPVDPDAQAFITAAAITDPTQQSAINQLVVDLKTYGIWSKMKAVYPFVGGTSTSNSYNLVNPSLYKITWYGGVSHNSNGITGSTNGYGDTFVPNNLMSQNNVHFSIYSRTNSLINATDFGSWNGGFGSAIYTRKGAGNFYAYANSGSPSTLNTPDSLGFYLVKRTTSNQITLQKNNSINTFASNSTNFITTSFKLLRPGEANAEYSSRNLAFCSIGNGMTDIEAANLYTAVQTFNTTLNRQVP